MGEVWTFSGTTHSPSSLLTLLYSRQIKVVPLRLSMSLSCPEPSRFWRVSTESFFAHACFARSWQAKKPYTISILFSSWKIKSNLKHLPYSRLSSLLPDRVVVMTSSFSDSIVFAVHTRKTAFSNSTVFKSFHSGQRFRNDLFSLIVFGVVVWTR